MSSAKQIIWNGPTEKELCDSYLTRSPVYFWVLPEGVNPGSTPPYKRPCIVVGMERSFEKPTEHDIAVQMIGLKMPGFQHFKYQPLNYHGEWVGYLDMGHKAYEGHSFHFP